MKQFVVVSGDCGCALCLAARGYALSRAREAGTPCNGYEHGCMCDECRRESKANMALLDAINKRLFASA